MAVLRKPALRARFFGRRSADGQATARPRDRSARVDDRDGTHPAPRCPCALRRAGEVGQSLVFGIVTAVDVVLGGGSVAFLDRENGAEEYARRLRDFMEARGLSRRGGDAMSDRAGSIAAPSSGASQGASRGARRARR